MTSSAGVTFLQMVNFIALISLASEVGGARGRRDQISNTHHIHVMNFAVIMSSSTCRAWLYKTEMDIVFLGKKAMRSNILEIK